ncbi:MAG: MT-A70 family methyltransferase [Acidobacteria bacterium]|nr:MT-A70 family methyltransferase [Acidobacteriota bacterium]
MRAAAKLGELLKEMKELGKLRGGRPKTVGGDDRFQLDEMGITKDRSHQVQEIAAIPEAKREALILAYKEKGGITFAKLKRMAKDERREHARKMDCARVASAAAPAEIDGVFSTIVIDPPWDFGDEGDVDQFGRGRPDYATMPIEEIRALPVGEKAAPDAHLYLWITNRSLPKGFSLLEAWGFRYVTCLVWDKESFGLGNYFRGQTELVLFGVRGSLPLKRKDVGTLFRAQRPKKQHSAKPPEFFALVESCSPGPYLEMFAREQRAGWVTWGNQPVPSDPPP